MILRSIQQFFIFLQDQVDAAVKQLLSLKAEYKQQTGQEYKPGMSPSFGPAPAQSSPAPPQSSSSPQAQALFSDIAQQGEQVRRLKAEKAPKVCLNLFANLFMKYYIFILALMIF